MATSAVARKLNIAGIGEVLMDLFPSGAATLGGAPLNVTFHVHQLLHALDLGEAVFVSAVGKDDRGASILGQIRDAGMTTGHVVVNPDHASGVAQVFESNGEAGFEILPDVAWDYLQPSAGLETLAKASQAVAFGSLAQRSPHSRATIQRFVSTVSGPRLYDVNLRRNTTDGKPGYSAEIVAESLTLATLVKLNEDELEEVAGMLGLRSGIVDSHDRILDLMEQVRTRYELTAVAVTRGPQGALLLGEGRCLQLPDSSLPADQVHPVGAGDSFGAGLLFSMVQGWSLGHCLELADTLSSWVVLHRSATPRLTPEVLTKIRALAARASADNLIADPSPS